MIYVVTCQGKEGSEVAGAFVSEPIATRAAKLMEEEALALTGNPRGYKVSAVNLRQRYRTTSENKPKNKRRQEKEASEGVQIDNELYEACKAAATAGEGRVVNETEIMRLYGYFTADPDVITKAYQAAIMTGTFSATWNTKSESFVFAPKRRQEQKTKSTSVAAST